MWRLGDVGRGTETVLRDLEVILQNRRLQRSFYRAHGGSLPHSILHLSERDEILKA